MGPWKLTSTLPYVHEPGLSAFQLAACPSETTTPTAILQLEFLRPITASMLSERRSKQPFGLRGGGPGAAGMNLIVRRSGRRVNMGGKATALLQVDRLLLLGNSLQVVWMSLQLHQMVRM
jgi:Hydantoinase B/oxoprolinase